MMASTTWGTSSSIALPCHVWSAAWRRATTSPRAIEVPCEWSTRLTLHCSCTLAACLHALQALNVLPACTSWKPMMALTSSALEECARAQETCGPSYIGRLARVLFMLVARGPHGTTGRVAAPEPSHRGGRVWSHGTHSRC
jgi:hypothetical protein